MHIFFKVIFKIGGYSEVICITLYFQWELLTVWTLQEENMYAYTVCRSLLWRSHGTANTAATGLSLHGNSQCYTNDTSKLMHLCFKTSIQTDTFFHYIYSTVRKLLSSRRKGSSYIYFLFHVDLRWWKLSPVSCQKISRYSTPVSWELLTA